MIEGLTPPAPIISAFFFLTSKLIYLKANSNPAISVLWPINLSFSVQIVLTELVFFASELRLSKNGITEFLNGTVTFAKFTSDFLIL